MNNTNQFSNYEFIKLDELYVMPDIRIVLIYARFMGKSTAVQTIETHFHSFYELHFALSGSCNICLKTSHEKVLEKGQYLLINPNTSHKFSSFSDDFFRLSVVFDIYKNNERIADDDNYTLKKCSEKILRFLDVITSEYKNMDFGSANIMNFHIYSTMMEILRETPSLLDACITKKNVQTAFKDAISFIRNNISLNITTSDVAAGVALSIRQLNRIFNSNIRMTVPEFIRNERIHRVREHLEKTNLPLQEIASLTGFNDEYILCKTFKKITGTTPGKYRTNYIKKGLENHYEKLN